MHGGSAHAHNKTLQRLDNEADLKIIAVVMTDQHPTNSHFASLSLS
jgi:hypothetical protein